MNTIPSHLVINAAIEKKFGEKFKLARSAFLWGSVLPDLPFGLLSWGTLLYYRFILQQDTSSVMENVIHPAYFNNPFWIAGHNFLHSPTVLIIYAILLWRFVDKVGTRGHWWLSFVFGCMVHSVIDILTHYNDGPVLLFPFDWHTRFYSPVSYWDTAHHASQFFWVELGINILLLGYLFLPKLIQRLKRPRTINH
ncbi:MAG: metal-dependent hydrolase [Anaerolineales bacterium]|nr:MAG: metal-dependent hydrolase [Anaerolineales bacterium]